MKWPWPLFGHCVPQKQYCILKGLSWGLPFWSSEWTPMRWCAVSTCHFSTQQECDRNGFSMGRSSFLSSGEPVGRNIPRSYRPHKDEFTPYSARRSLIWVNWRVTLEKSQFLALQILLPGYGEGWSSVSLEACCSGQPKSWWLIVTSHLEISVR